MRFEGWDSAIKLDLGLWSADRQNSRTALVAWFTLVGAKEFRRRPALPSLRFHAPTDDRLISGANTDFVELALASEYEEA